MRTAVNQVGFAIERHDGEVVGWTAITAPVALRTAAEQQLKAMKLTLGAEYRVNVALALTMPGGQQ